MSDLVFKEVNSPCSAAWREAYVGRKSRSSQVGRSTCAA